MKKALSILLIFIFVFTFVGCDDTTVTEDHLAPDKVFQFEEIKITLTEAFEIDEQDDTTVWYESENGELSVSIDKYDIPIVNEEPQDLDAFAADFFKKPPYKPLNALERKDELLGAECEVKFPGFDFIYFISFYESESSYYVAYFMYDKADKEMYDPYITKWAKSVTVASDATEV